MGNNDEGKIYVAQTHLVLELDCLSSLENADTFTIKYIKPDGITTGFWDDNIVITDAALGIIERTSFAASDLDEAGQWIVWAYVEYTDGTVAPGEPDYLQVWNEGE